MRAILNRTPDRPLFRRTSISSLQHFKSLRFPIPISNPEEERMKKTGKRFVPAIVVLSLVLSAIGLAQEGSGAGSQRVIVHAGKLLDVRSGKTLSDQAIVIDGGKILSVGPMSQANRSSGDRFVDLPNATVLPGLTDAHTHLTGNPQDVGPQALSISIPRATLTGARNARLTLEARGLQRRRPARRH
jgi:hypothetical protein